MNILYVHTHDTGRQIQPYGHAVATPHLQRFAEQGLLFRNAHCAGPTCSPSRASLMTGTWPHCNGMIGLAHRGSRLLEPRQHLASFLGRNGFETALFGVDHEGNPSDNGYQAVWRPPRTDWAAQAMATADEAGRFFASSRDRPFFASCGFMLTHRCDRGDSHWHQETGPRGDGRYVRPPAPLPDTPDTRQDLADFNQAVQAYDAAFGRLLQALDASGHSADTLVLVTTDHGIAFPLMKCNLTVHGTGVLFMLRGPGGFGGGAVRDALVSQIDFYPTVCELAGLPVPEWVKGRSLRPLALGAGPIHDEIFAEVNYHAAYEPMRAVRTDRHLYIRRLLPRPHPVLPNCDQSTSRQVMIDAGWRQRPQPEEELYDSLFDPSEISNRAADPACTAVLADLRRRLDRWMRETCDPALDGSDRRRAAELGMRVNPPDGLNPQDPSAPERMP